MLQAWKQDYLLLDIQQVLCLACSADSFVALDAEYVGVGPFGLENALARVSLVDWQGRILLDSFAKVDQPVVDYRTWCSGIREADLINAPSFDEVRDQVVSLLDNRVLVGHALHNDLHVLDLEIPQDMLRDTQCFPPVQHLCTTAVPSLRAIVRCLGGSVAFQSGEHSPIEDARSAMHIYLLYAELWESWLQSPFVGLWALLQPPMPPRQERHNKPQRARKQQRPKGGLLPPTPPSSPPRQMASPRSSSAEPMLDFWPLTPPSTPPQEPIVLKELPEDWPFILATCDSSDGSRTPTRRARGGRRQRGLPVSEMIQCA